MSTEKVKVAVRVRPMNRREIDLGTKYVVDMEGNQTILYHHQNSPHDGGGERGSGAGGRKAPKTFAFDHCFWSMDENNPKFAGQEHVFNCLGQDVLRQAFDGYNGCIFAYGQTGSGKSYSMMGTFKEDGKGIIPRICDALFERIAQKDSPDLGFKVEVSYMEIYNEKVHDLLDPKGSKQNLKVREHNILGPYVDGLSMLAVASFEDIDNLMNEGNKSRTVAATNMNNESSRSHAVFNIILTQTRCDTQTGLTGEKVSKLSLVDLAGSERVQKTGAMGDRLREGSNINKSLTTLGLVISALADQNKAKSKFVPYRDSVLTWLLKDNLGGNSKTVMIATVSPSADNYEETLSTLRYADRAKRIVNHAVVNEDPNARIIRELREEVTQLKQRLTVAQVHPVSTEQGEEEEEAIKNDPDLRDRLEETEKLFKQKTKTWEEKLAETERIHQERHEALEKMGVSVQTSGIKVETGTHYLVNLNADPSMNELLVYYLKDHTLVGSTDAVTQQDIQLSGLGIHPEHCLVTIEVNDVFLSPLEGARTCVNGSKVVQKTRVRHGDRILWGNNHFFRLNCPKLNSPQSTEPDQPIDYNFAQQELMSKEFSNDPIQEAIIAIEQQYEEDKQEALEKQKQSYERQMQILRSQLMSPGTPSMPFLPMSPNMLTPTGSMSAQSSIQRKYQEWAQQRDKSIKQSLAILRDEVVKANSLVREANVLAQEMGKLTEFQVTLQIPAANLSPNRRRGAFVSEPAILVKRKGRGNQIWSMEKFENKIIDMRDMYEERKATGLPMMVEDEHDSEPWDEGPPVKGDPFYESQENHNLIGVANVFLECLFHDVKLDYQVPIISQQGEIAGKLHVEISKLGGSFLDRYADTNDDGEETAEPEPVGIGSPMIVRICISGAKGLPPALSNFVFCQYTFWGNEDTVVVPPEIHPDSSAHKKSDTISFKFQHSKDFKVYITEEFIEHCSEGALSIEVWGHRSPGFGLVNNGMDNIIARSRTLADRWSEVMRQIELWTEVHELNHQGEYVPVQVQPKPEVPSAGVFQLQQGHTRRVFVRIKPVANSGTLPLICDSVSSIQVGCIYVRNKIQKGLDSYQEVDLTHLRDRWSDALARRKDYLNEQLQKLINKQDKSDSDVDRERALMDQWMSLTDERNAVMVPSPGSGIPGAPAEWEAPEDLEEHRPVLFLDLNADDMSTSGVKEGFQAAGVNSILVKEHASTFVNLPIIKTFTEKDNVCAVASWDSSIHDSPYLNRVTQSNERVYLILKTVVRLSHPAYMELVLRKRMCINIYNNFSISNLTDRLKKRITGAEKSFASGVTYDVVSNIPKASEDLENMESLAQVAASQNEISATDGETYIEKYIKGISSVESILTLDRLRQNVAVKELTASTGLGLRKTTSVPNIHAGALSPMKLEGQLRADSIQDLSLDALSLGQLGSHPARPNFLNLRTNSYGSISKTSPKSLLSPIGTKVATVKPMMTLMEEQYQRETKPLLRQDTEEDLEDEEPDHKHHIRQVEPDPHSIGSDEFQDFESYETQQGSLQEDNKVVNSTEDGHIVHSSTTDSLVDIQGKNCTPSLVSSGYGSQAVSMLTLSSEDSLSLRSNEDNTESNKESRGVQKGNAEQANSSGDSDLEEGSTDSTQEGDKILGTADQSAEDTKQQSTMLEDKEKYLSTDESLSGKDVSDLDISVASLRRPNLPDFDTTGTSLDESKGDNYSLTQDKGKGGNSTGEWVDPYSETAMEELEKLGLDEAEESHDFTEHPTEQTHKDMVELFIREDGDSEQDKGRILASTPIRRRNLNLSKRARPSSCIVSPSSHADTTASIIEESMKRNSLVLDTTDDMETSAGEDALSVCSFGSRADLDRLQEVPVPPWIQIGESVIVNSSKGPAKTGFVQFVGNVEFAGGQWVGVELDLPEGKNDGSVHGIRYFKCRSRHGVFVRHDKVLLDKKRRGSRKMAKRHSMGAKLSGSNSNISFSPGVTSPGGNSPSYLKGTSSSYAKKK
ncbi:kinesin-like protein KIF13B isoform X2 [Mizuhopecten yessoensis]|uniref:kinesin-like protein KIF13B isoform X2 n=1 Tax=Mizuhopecten yessoensis TaxID=6573 RepID=UPI000B45F725|nr:kinesin-like protein KIF13B isoform X2 [Mizuhopecten yessoensis]